MLTGCMPCILRVDKLNNIGRIINMITVNAIGDTCPIPVVKTKKAIEALTQPDTVETLVDNEIAVDNLKKMAAQKGYSCDSNKLDDGSDSVKLTIETLNPGAFSDTDEASQYTCRPATDNRVVVIRSSYMGEGSEELGSVLIKGFIYAHSQQDNPPETMLIYNGGAKLTCIGFFFFFDLKVHKNRGVKIFTCGTCLNYYELSDKLAVGEVTNMYDIAEKMAAASLIVSP